VNYKGPLIALSLLALAGCAGDPGFVDASGLTDDADAGPPPADQSEAFGSEDSAGRLMPTRHVPAWRSRVAVYSANPELRKEGTALIEMNFNVRLVSVPDSRFLIRLEPQRDGGFHVSTQFNGVRTEGPTLPKGLKGHEETQDEFLDFVGEQMEKVQ
jgi:hypothetical protein